MSKTMWIVLATAGLAGLAMSAGCTDEHVKIMQQWERWDKYPSDWNDPLKLPLGTQFDSRPEVQQLADADLLKHMNLWLDTREAYLTAWRRGGDHDPEVVRLQNRMATLTVVIQSRRDQLVGQPIIRGG